jgi:hypothetical protein
MRKAAGIAMVAILAGIGWEIAPAAQGKPVRTVKDGVLDQIKLYVEKPPSAMHAVMKPFSSEGLKGDNEDTKKMKVDAPGMLAERFASKLKELGPFTDVSSLTSGASPAADALIVEGKFTEMDPGSRVARSLVGFGAGKSGVTVEGSVTSADGKVLAQFEQRRLGVMGVAGGNSLDKLQSDTRDIGEDIAKFLSAWAKGQKLN